MRRASWSLALKSAAVSVAKAVGSKVGCSPTVATSWPERSTRSASRALLSERNFCSNAVIATESASLNDQLAEPLTVAPLPSSRHRSPGRDRLRDRDAVRVFEVAANRNPARDARDGH